MKKTFIILIVILLAVSCSNNNKPDKGYYDTGELKWEKIPDQSNNKLVHITDYSKNGNIRRKFSLLLINDSISFKDGPYEEYYSDGSLKWKGIYTRGEQEHIGVNRYVISTIMENSYIKFFDNPEIVKPNETVYLKTNGTYTFRINLNDIYSDQYAVYTKYNDVEGYRGYREVMDSKDSDYPYTMVTPNRESEMDIVCIFADADGQIIVGQSPSVTFKVKVVTDKPQ